VTDWGDGACQQYLPFIEAPLALGAAIGWCAESNPPPDLARALSAQVFEEDGDALGSAVVALANTYLALGVEMSNASALARLLWRPHDIVDAPPFQAVTREGFGAAAARVAEALQALSHARSRRDDASLIIEEIRAGGDLLALLCRDGLARLTGDGTIEGMPVAARHELETTARELAERHETIWLARNRRGGLDESLRPLRKLAFAYDGL
jgi:hypothetical protein